MPLPPFRFRPFIKDITTMPISNMILQLATGLLTSVNIFFLTLLFTFPFGLLVALVRMSKNPFASNIARIYISIMRGTPLMLQLLIVYFGPYYVFGWSLRNYPPFVAVIIAFVLNYSAYFAEIYRGGIASIPNGQYEAAEVLGYTRVQTFMRIILPQVIKRIMPSVTNEVVTLVKDTSMAFTVSYQEMFTIGKQIANSQTSFTPFVIAGIFYYLFNWIVDRVMGRCEKALDYYE